MKNKKYLWIVSVVFIFMLLGQGTSPSPVFAKSEKPFVIGYICNEAWPVAAEAYYAIKLAADEINNAGGILGKTIKIFKVDSKGQAPIAVAGYRNLVMNKNADMVIIGEGAELNVALQEAGAKLYPEYHHLTFNPTTAYQPLGTNVLNEYDKYKFYFRTFGDMNIHMQGTTRWGKFMKSKGLKKTALLIEDSAWTEYMRKGWPGKYAPSKENLEEIGLDVVYYAVTSTREKMFIPVLQAVADSGAEWVAFVCAYSDVTTLVKQWGMSPAKDIPIWVTGGSSQMAAFWNITGGAALGFITTMYDRAALSPKTIPFVDNLREKYKKDPNWVGFGSYDSIYVVKEAAEKSKSTKTEDLIKALEKIEYTGVYGIIKYDEMHSCKTGWPYMDFPYAQYQKNGELVVIFPEEVAEATNPGKSFIPINKLR